MKLYNNHEKVAKKGKGTFEALFLTMLLTQMTWFLLVLWFDIPHRHTHKHRGHIGTGTNRLVHLLYAHNSYLYHTEWIICGYKNSL